MAERNEMNEQQAQWRKALAEAAAQRRRRGGRRRSDQYTKAQGVRWVPPATDQQATQ
ncbi:hypothetical protein [Kribbella sp. NPDC004536]|uniref:hypothetical protein n=1 Tax=Kribbella sp. NPDC004536 TaxID=3364106 RepID=UPI00368E521D